MNHCSTCGAKYVSLTWPRKCGACNAMVYRNPTPVGVLVLPVEMGGYDWPSVLVQQRGIPPKVGQWALTGGFVEMGESAEKSMVRELDEELGLKYSGRIRLMMTRTTAEGRMLIFGVADRIRLSPNFISGFLPTPEVQAVKVMTQATMHDLCFPTHTEAMRQFFAESGRWWY